MRGYVPRKIPAGLGAIDDDPALNFKKAREAWHCSGADLSARSQPDPTIRSYECLRVIPVGDRYVYSSLSGKHHCRACALTYELGGDFLSKPIPSEVEK